MLRGSGRCTEVIATGTAAIATSISALGDADGQIYHLTETRVSDRVRAELLAIQTRQAPDSFGWTMDILGEDEAHAVAQLRSA